MFSCTVTRDGDDAVVQLRGEGHVQQAQEVHAALLNAMEVSRRVVIEVASDHQLGLPILQLIWSAQRLAEQTGHVVEFKNSSALVLEEAMRRAGFKVDRERGDAPAPGE